MHSLESGLSHIRIMRVFHCNSIYEYSGDDTSEPGGSGSITMRLLEYGAWRVEGSMTLDNYLEFLSSLINLFFLAGEFATIVRMLCLARGAPYMPLLERAQKFKNDVIHGNSLEELLTQED